MWIFGKRWFPFEEDVQADPQIEESTFSEMELAPWLSIDIDKDPPIGNPFNGMLD